MEFNEMTKEELINYINEIQEDKSGKYGLLWDREKEPEKTVVECGEQIPILEECKKKFINNGGFNNLLIEGDNFHSLSILNYTHNESVDIIYIDPPYNTNNKDFIYNDKFVDSEDGYRHSKWLNFMEKRLKLSRNLLKKDGMIFISIDDNELFQLKLLCDKIFGEKNYINTISINIKNSSGASGGGEDKKLKKNIEYILFYCKNISSFKLNIVYKDTELMKYIENMKNEEKSFKYTSVLMQMDNVEYYKTIKAGSGEDIIIKKVGNCKIKSVKQIAKEEKISLKEVYYKYYEKIMTTTNAQTSIRTKVWDATDSNDSTYIAEYIPRTGKNKNKKVQLIFKGKQKVLVIWLKDTSYKKKNTIYKKEKIGTYWDYVGETKNLSKEGNVKFENGKKPVKMIEQILQLHPNINSSVLDFFAGSGTTGHAVLELNKLDGGNRKFILCTNNENNICEEKTYIRMKNVINGYGKREPFSGTLKYFKTDFVDNNGTKDQLYYDLTEKCIPMLCIKGDTFEEVEKNNEYVIYSNKSKTEYSCVYFDVLGQRYDQFVKRVSAIKEHKLLYVFTLGDSIDESDFKNSENYTIEAIPYKIVELYKKIVKMSRE